MKWITYTFFDFWDGSSQQSSNFSLSLHFSSSSLAPSSLSEDNEAEDEIGVDGLILLLLLSHPLPFFEQPLLSVDALTNSDDEEIDMSKDLDKVS